MFEQLINSIPLRKVPLHIADAEDYLYMIVERIDGRIPDVSLVNAAQIERVVFIQDLDNRNNLYALLVVGNRNLAVLVRTGAFHLDPGHPGRVVLNAFRNWLEAHGVVRRELRFAAAGTYERIIVQSFVRQNDLSSRQDPEQLRLFNAWNINNATTPAAPVTASAGQKTQRKATGDRS